MITIFLLKQFNKITQLIKVTTKTNNKNQTHCKRLRINNLNQMTNIKVQKYHNSNLWTIRDNNLNNKIKISSTAMQE